MNDTEPQPRDGLLRCDEALEIASASLDGEASLEEIDRLALHLVACAGCRARIETLEGDDTLLRGAGLPAHDVPAHDVPTHDVPSQDVPSQDVPTHDTIHDLAPVVPITGTATRRDERRGPQRSRRRWIPAAVAAATMAAATVAGILLLRPPADPRPVEIAGLEQPGEGLRESVSAPSVPAPPEDPPAPGHLEVALEQRLAQAETLLAHHPRANPFRSRRSNPFRDSASDRSSNPELQPFDGPHPFRTPGRSNRSRQRL